MDQIDIWPGCWVATPNATYSHAIHDFGKQTFCGLVLDDVRNNTMKTARKMVGQPAFTWANRVKWIRRFRLTERYEARFQPCPKCSTEARNHHGRDGCVK